MRKLSDLRFRELVTSPPSESAFKAAAKMEDAHVGCILVTKDKEVVGIVTRFDFIHNIIVLGKNSKKTTVNQIMDPKPTTIDAQSSTTDALRTMVQNKIGRLVVKSGKQILGVLSLEDIVANLEVEAVSRVADERQDQIFDMVKRLTPTLLARYDGEEKISLQREMTDEAKALLRLLEEAEIALRH
jgi:signal-transduction protein with cAMP-binding, CBS, and nucleotidyltransferase domain